MFTYETLPIDGKEQLRDAILECFGRDISTVFCESGTRNYAFIFDDGSYPAVIRVGIEAPHRTAEDVLCELMFVDDLRNDVPTVCQPIVSLKNRIVEQVVIGEQTYLLTMFRKANGDIYEIEDWDEQYCYRVGALLGKMHRTSYESYELGLRYKRKSWNEFPYFDFSRLDGHIADQTRLHVEELKKKIETIPKDPHWYGMIHGDFIHKNLYNDWDTVWAFDFDDSCYGYFMFDIATFFQGICLMNGDSPKYPKDFEDFVYGSKGVYTKLREGYESEWKLPEEQWELFDDFFRLRLAEIDMIFIISKMVPSHMSKAIIGGTELFLEPGDRPILRSPQVFEYIKSMIKPTES